MTPVEEVAKRAYEQYVARCLVLSDEPGASSPTPVSFKHFKIAWVHTVESEIKARLNGDDERWSADTHDQPIPATKLVYPWDEEKAFYKKLALILFSQVGKGLSQRWQDTMLCEIQAAITEASLAFGQTVTLGMIN